MTYQMTKFVKKYFERYCDANFPGEAAGITAKAEPIFDRFMHEAPDMGKNMMASNMDITAAFFAYYEASDHRIAGEAMLTLIEWLTEDFKWVGSLLDMNKHRYIRPLYYKIYGSHAKKVEEHKARGEWTGTWSIRINPEGKKDGIAYHMVGCPLYAFVKAHGYEELMPYVCRFDFIFERFLHARLIRTQTEATGGSCCDYWFLPDKSELAESFRDFQSV